MDMQNIPLYTAFNLFNRITNVQLRDALKTLLNDPFMDSITLQIPDYSISSYQADSKLLDILTQLGLSVTIAEAQATEESHEFEHGSFETRSTTHYPVTIAKA